MTRASAIASVRPRKGPSTRLRSSAPRASSDAPILPPCRPAAHGLGVFGQRSFCKLVRRGGALAIDAILERRIPSRGADALRSPAHLPQVLHQPTTQVKCLCARQVRRRLRQQHKKPVGAEGGGTTANHSSFMNTISAWCRRAQIPHRGTRTNTFPDGTEANAAG